jgi:hypothetical protein
MLVYFVASRKDIANNIEKLRRFVKLIHDEGHTLTLDWIEPIYASEKKGSVHDIDWPILYKDTVEAITRADVVIAETSIQSFGVGFQVALAIQLKKPTLLLRVEDMDSFAFAAGIPQQNALYKTYDDKSIEPIVHDFLRQNDITSKDMRFNFFIDRKIYNYLRWSAAKTGKTKAEILRELVEQEIDRDGEPNI